MNPSVLASSPLLLCAAVATCLAAETPRCVVLSPPACSFPSLDRAAFLHALRVELASAGFEVEEASCRSPGLVVTVEPVGCEQAAHALEIAVAGPGAGERSTRVVSIDDVGGGMLPRTLALAATEAVENTAHGTIAASVAPEPPGAAQAPVPASSAALAPPPLAPAPPARPPPAPEMIALPGVFARPPPPRPSAVLGALLEYRAYVAPPTQLLGGRVSTAWATAVDGLELRGDAVFAQTTRNVALGSISVDAVAAAAGAQFATQGDPLTVFVGSTAEVGYAWTIGRPRGSAEGGRGGRVTIALAAAVGARLAFAAHWLALVEAGGGVELAGLRALVDDVAVGGVSGGHLFARAGGGYAF